MTTVQTDNGNTTESLVNNAPNTRQVAEYIRTNLLIPTIESASKQFEQYLSGQPIGITSTTTTTTTTTTTAASNNNTSNTNTNTNTTTGGDSSDGGKENKQMKNSLPTEISNRVLELIKGWFFFVLFFGTGVGVGAIIY
ncbi:hypothetical protein AX774_g3983 [Zancudomyces culisetae]|uniref:Uncharacterized protein n=1 Tax=Zancudomyces culisetae TaxID=1213189 RepID=A0A1R1PNS6_ZANCU|nr:hypothetical protein AX774_g3983 [Zancudomyces culisetae]|eukprot:OMH82532.1 hypothetical protein AX774_g3983 [Zancudomyces culisetae]